MRNRPYFVCGLLVVAALGWAAWQALRSLPPQVPEPVHEGTPLSCVLADRITTRVVQRFGGHSNAVPFLIKALNRDSWVGAAYYRKCLWPKLPISMQKHLSPPPADDAHTRLNAAVLLGRIGPVAEPSIPALIRALKEDDNKFVRIFAAVALRDLGAVDKEAIAALTDALKDPDGQVRLWASGVLLELDPEAAAKAGVKVPSP